MLGNRTDADDRQAPTLGVRAGAKRKRKPAGAETDSTLSMMAIRTRRNRVCGVPTVPQTFRVGFLVGQIEKPFVYKGFSHDLHLQQQHAVVPDRGRRTLIERFTRVDADTLRRHGRRPGGVDAALEMDPDGWPRSRRRPSSSAACCCRAVGDGCRKRTSGGSATGCAGCATAGAPGRAGGGGAARHRVGGARGARRHAAAAPRDLPGPGGSR